MSLFPMFVKLEGREVVVVGGGAIAEQKLPGLFAANARALVVAPEVTPRIAAWADAERLRWRRKKFDGNDLDGAFLVVAATSAPGVNEAVFREAEARGLLCNAVDDIAHCHFYYGAVVQRGDFQIAISTNGKSPALAQRIRTELEAQFGEGYAAWLDWLGAARERLRTGSGEPEANKAILHRLASRESFGSFQAKLAPQKSAEGAA